MNVLAVVHKYPPLHNAGAEYMLHAVLRFLAGRGHQVTVVCASRGVAPGPWELDGISVEVNYRPGRLVGATDVVITHLDLTRVAVRLAAQYRVPVVHLVHNHRQLDFNRVLPDEARLVVFNSHWLAAEVAWPGRNLVLYPPVDRADYETTPGDAVMLANLAAAKGAATFYAVAAALPERSFLGVQGAYAPQDTRAASNVELIDNTPRMRELYGRTRVVLMPSLYESFGRVAVEAAWSGIPTIAHPTAGLRESLGPAGLFVDRDDVTGYVDLVRHLDDPAFYADVGAAYRARAETLARLTGPQLEELDMALANL